MKKITSFMIFMIMLVLCCTSAFAQDIEETLDDKQIKLGVIQAEMVPGQWYFLHSPRNKDTEATAFGMPGDQIQAAGGFIVDKGTGTRVFLTATDVISEVDVEEGVAASAHLDKIVRFIAVDGKEGAYRVQFANENYIGADPETNGTVTKYNAAGAGEYNFYLVKNLDGEPNTAGRFGWNKYNMAGRVDNNGGGFGINFWGNGETKAETEKTEEGDFKWNTDEEIMGNRIWQIYNVEILGNVDLFESEIQALIALMDEIYGREENAYVDNLREGINVGDSYGNYRPEDVEAFLALFDLAESIVADYDSGTLGMTAEAIKASREELAAADEQVQNNKIPLAVSGIAPGYYTINSMVNWHANDTVNYTQEECDAFNTENQLTPGAEGFLTTDSVKVIPSIKALMARTNGTKQYVAWAKREEKSTFLWKLEEVAGRPTEYRLINMYKGQTFNNVPTSSHIELVQDDTITMVFDYQGEHKAPIIEENVTVYSIRLKKNQEGEQHYIHAGGHQSGAGKADYAVGWNPGSTDASGWYLAKVDDGIAQGWIEGDAAKLQKMFDVTNNIFATVPDQFEVAKDIVVTIHEKDSVITDVKQFKSKYTSTAEGSLNSLLDGDPSTYWHSDWGSEVGPLVHYLQINADEPLEGVYAVKISRRPVNTDHPTKLAVRGYDEDNEDLGINDGVDLGTLMFNASGAGKWDVSNNLFDGKGYAIIRFYLAGSTSDAKRGYWHCGDFNIFKATESTYHEKTQYQERADIISRLQTAMDAWNAAGYSVDNVELYADATFQAAYKELTEAADAWAAVYVNPAALREAIEDAPAENLFVIGTNPGWWPAGTVTPAASVDAAKAYDETGKYTPAESEAKIKAIADATTNVFAAANKVQTNKWYRIKFPTEQMFETYNWKKSEADTIYSALAGVVTNPELFGKTLASGKLVTEYVDYDNEEGEVDTLSAYTTDVVEEIIEGNSLVFFDKNQLETIKAGEDLFRFIEATDSSFIIQHKASGLFMNAPGTGSAKVTLSSIPTYFQVSAVGTGANVIGMTTILGKRPSAYVNIHAARQNNLVCWNDKNLGSKTPLLIEEAETVTTEPATNYKKKLWPGSFYAYTSPVDITVGTGATAYGAELVMTDKDTTVVLKEIEAEVITAGTPYILIADSEEDYITPADRLKEIASTVLEEEGKYGKIEQQIANERLDEEYAYVEMSHGMAVNTHVKGLGDLVGTYENVTIDAGKAIVTKNNGFAHTTQSTTISAYAAYVKCDFDPNSTDVVGTIKVDFDGTVDTGINDILNTVAKSGNIYTIDGKLVGKGNINAINKMPAGVYIINGTKVVKN